MWEPSWSWSRRALNDWLNWFPVRQRAAHLICHDHDLAVAEAPQRLGVVVAFLVLQANYFDDVVDLCVLHDLRSDSSLLSSSSSLPDGGVSTYLLVRGLADVEDLPSERENSVAVPPDDAESRHGQRLGRVSLSEDERALGGVSPPWGGQRSSSHFSTFRRSSSVVTAAAEGFRWQQLTSQDSSPALFKRGNCQLSTIWWTIRELLFHCHHLPDGRSSSSVSSFI